MPQAVPRAGRRPGCPAGKSNLSRPLAMSSQGLNFAQGNLLVHPDDVVKSQNALSLATRTGFALTSLRVRNLLEPTDFKHQFVRILLRIRRHNCPACSSSTLSPRKANSYY
jgi:hypothetical protein